MNCFKGKWVCSREEKKYAEQSEGNEVKRLGSGKKYIKRVSSTRERE